MVRMPAGDCGSREARGGNEAKRAWRALGGLCLGTFVCFTNTTAFNIALPAISVSLGAGQVEQQWMVSAYNLVFGAFMLLAGSLGDRWGVKRTLLVGASAFAAASAAGVLATSSVTTIAARGVMGFGAGFSITMTLALITRLFESDGQVLALTMNAVAMTLGAPFGLVLGGLLVNFADWRAIFVFDLVAFLIVLLLDILLLPGDRSQSGGATGARARLPLLSALLALAGLALVSAGLINAQISAASPDSWGPMVAGALVIAVFVRRDTRSSNPLAELGLLRIPSFAAASLSLLALNVAISGIMFVLPAYVETALGNSALVGALMLMPMVVAAMVGAAITRKVSDRLGKRRACVASLVLIALGLAVMAASTAVAGYPLMVVGQCACGLGMAMGLPVMQGWAMERVPDRRRGGGSALVSTFQQLGCLIGIGALGSLVGSSYAAACRGTAAEGFASISLAFEAADAQSASQAHVVRAAASSAYAHAVLVAFCAAAVVLLLIAALAAVGSRSGAGER